MKTYVYETHCKTDCDELGISLDRLWRSRCQVGKFLPLFSGAVLGIGERQRRTCFCHCLCEKVPEGGVTWGVI